MKYSIQRKMMSQMFAFGVLSGCGTFVPEIQEPWVSPLQGEEMVQALVKHVHCEVERAVKDVITRDKKLAAVNNGPRDAEWLEKWGAQIALTLTIDESSNLNPGVTFNTPIIPATVAFPGLASPISISQMYNFGLGGTLSSDGTRIDKLSSYFTVKELLTEPSFCAPPSPNDPPKLSFLDGDLRLEEWLLDAVLVQGTNAADISSKAIEGQFKQNVISHEVKFMIVSSGNITPSWTLVRVSANSSSFFGANRTRTHDLIVTFGPNEETTTATGNKKAKQVASNKPSQAASNAQLASEIGLAVANSLRSVLQQ
ncbi:MAG: hypothetical protein WBW81_08240 [Methylocella sp.]